MMHLVLFLKKINIYHTYSYIRFKDTRWNVIQLLNHWRIMNRHLAGLLSVRGSLILSQGYAYHVNDTPYLFIVSEYVVAASV